MIFSEFLVDSLEMKVRDVMEQLGFEEVREFGDSPTGGH